jgi:hypothetical protein
MQQVSDLRVTQLLELAQHFAVDLIEARDRLANPQDQILERAVLPLPARTDQVLVARLHASRLFMNW